eukprot:CAMPEP_0170472578 /NCGR_PEP_ID=MMETSP0123-20130129/14597_1 /TAXON_ID=182087 /ORGANISM="Favella ehrenbergii, Strain Fehren 1" /LENGTH=128 /DNA_ID=CAMNT_0010740965 /DNA_START=47 /DNA_END=433 /DNA_ORIENTATION=-
MRASLRPINNILIGHFKNAKAHPMGFQFFSALGYGTHKVETILKNAGKESSDKDGESAEDAGISDEQAFNAGVDWFSEIVFFYGILLGVCYWEFKKFAASQRKLNQRIKDLEDNSEQIMEAVGRVKDR